MKVDLGKFMRFDEAIELVEKHWHCEVSAFGTFNYNEKLARGGEVLSGSGV